MRSQVLFQLQKWREHCLSLPGLHTPLVDLKTANHCRSTACTMGNTEKADFMCESLRKVSWSKEYISRLLKMNWSLPGGWLWGFSTEWKQYVQNGDSKKNDFGRVSLTWLE